MPRTTITVTNNWRRFENEIDRGVTRALERGRMLVVREARGVPTRYRIHGILDKLRWSAVRRRRGNRGGWDIIVTAVDFREIFFEKGTYKRRRAKLKQPGRRKVGSELRGGVKAGHFMAKGLRAAYPHLIELLKRELPG